MKPFILLLVLAVLSVWACKQNVSNKQIKTKTTVDTSNSFISDSLEYEKRLSKRDSVYKIFSNKQVDTSDYKYLPFWNDSMNRYGDVYIDTFSVNGSNFRLISPFDCNCTGGNTIFLEQKKNGHWEMTKLELDDNIHGGNLGRDLDINGDGFPDIYNTTRFTADIYFFDPSKNTFIDSAASDYSLDFYEIDSLKRLFCDFQQLKTMCGQINSTLYTFKGFQKYVLYNLELYNCDETKDERDLITKLILSKCINGNEDSVVIIHTTKLAHPIEVDGYDEHGKYPNGTDQYFDYKAYWKSKYKKSDR